MIVKELLAKADAEHVAELAAQAFPYEHYPRVDRNTYKAVYLRFLTETIPGIIPKLSDEYIVIGTSSCHEDGTMYQEGLLFRKSEILQTNKEIPHLESRVAELLEVTDADACWECVREISENQPEAYGIEFTPWDEILGYEVDEWSVKDSIDEIAYSIVNEMTFNGFDEESWTERRAELDDALREAEEWLELPEEERARQTVSSEDLKKKYGYEDTRTPEEKEQDSLAAAKNSLRNVFESFKALQMYLERHHV